MLNEAWRKRNWQTTDWYVRSLGPNYQMPSLAYALNCPYDMSNVHAEMARFLRQESYGAIELDPVEVYGLLGRMAVVVGGGSAHCANFQLWADVTFRQSDRALLSRPELVIGMAKGPIPNADPDGLPDSLRRYGSLVGQHFTAARIPDLWVDNGRGGLGVEWNIRRDERPNLVGTPPRFVSFETLIGSGQ